MVLIASYVKMISPKKSHFPVCNSRFRSRIKATYTTKRTVRSKTPNTGINTENTTARIFPVLSPVFKPGELEWMAVWAQRQKNSLSISHRTTTNVNTTCASAPREPLLHLQLRPRRRCLVRCFCIARYARARSVLFQTRATWNADIQRLFFHVLLE